jgi:hypothetical protein
MFTASNTKKTDDRSIIERSVSFLLLGLICIFALNSIGNVQKYVSQYHQHWTGDALGIAFGTVVFVCAYIAATTGGHPRWVAVVIGTVFGLASAHFQTELYTSEGMQLGTARALSYIPILAGEVGLALLESLYSRQHRQQVAAERTDELLAQLHERDSIIADLQKCVDEQSQQIAALGNRLQVARPSSQLAEGVLPFPHQNGYQGVAIAQMPVHTGAATTSQGSQRLGDLNVANDARAALKEQRKAAIPQILAAANRALSTGELANQLQASFGWQVSSDSVRRYCQELMEAKLLESVNRKWQLCLSTTNQCNNFAS